jgi:ABC-type transport system involved in cytochrome bd biosynthesis fused ATPase/permease subunit
MMGGFFLIGGVLACLVGYWASRPLESAARRARHHDGAWAATIQQALEQGDLVGSADGSSIEDDEGSEGDAHSRRILGAASMAAHALLGLNVCLAIWTGVTEIRSGALAPGELFLFIAYALMIHRRLVDAGRQVARVGKLRAAVERLAALLGDASDELAPTLPLHESVRTEGLRVEAVRGSRPRLDDVALELRAGERVAIVGRPGDGKSTLLRCLAGLEPTAEGRLYWDGVELAPFDASLCASVGYLPQDPVLPRAPVWQHLGLSGPDALDAGQAELLRRVGTLDVIERLPKGIRQKVASASLSRQEARLLALGAVLLSDAPLIALDSPFEGLSKRAAAERVDAVFDAVRGRTLVVALPRSHDAAAFTRVVVMRRGRIGYDGALADRQALKAARLEEEALACRA